MRKRQKGVAAVELALLLIPMLLFAFGATELGRAHYEYNMLLKSARDAARYRTVVSLGAGEEEARCLAVYGRFDSLAKPGQMCSGPNKLLEGLTPAMVQVPAAETGVDTGSGTITLVRVTISGYVFISLVEFIIPDIPFGPVSVTMRHSAS